jgi:hypothetical protein
MKKIIETTKEIKDLEIVMFTCSEEDIGVEIINLPKKLIKNYQRFDGISGVSYTTPLIDILTQIYVLQNYNKVISH